MSTRQEKIDRLFRFDCYPHDFLLDVAALDPDEAGVFTIIMMMIYAKRAPIDNDPEEISRKLKNLTPKRCKNIINILAEKDFIQIMGGKLHQRRASHELNLKQTHLERSSNGGQTTAERKREANKNKDMPSSKTQFPVPTPPPPRTPTASHRDITPNSVSDANGKLESEQNDQPPDTPIGKQGVENKFSSDGVRRGSAASGSPPAGTALSNKTYRIALLLDANAIQRARELAPTCNMTDLLALYDKNINTGKMPAPDNPNAAFPKWCERYHQGIVKNVNARKS